MDLKISSSSRPAFDLELAAAAGLIVRTQRESGELPWSEGDKTDPWDMVEAVMGLSIGGYHTEARKAFEWLANQQLSDGSWYSYYRNGEPEDRTREANMSSYIAVGVYHYYLVTGDRAFVERMWKTVCSGIDFSLSLQNKSGEIYWAVSPTGEVDPMALLTGCSSIYLSLKCALALADLLGRRRKRWKEALEALGDAIRNKPTLFNMTKSRFSMDWFYPILCGAVSGDMARERVEKYWKKFVVKDRGVRCVSDQPWITVAESSELCMALAAMGNRKLSEIVFGWLQENRFDDGSYWCGYTFPDMIVWPGEKLTWTNAAVLLAADALYDITPAGRIFCHRFWSNPEFSSILRDEEPQEEPAPSRGPVHQEPLFRMSARDLRDEGKR